MVENVSQLNSFHFTILTPLFLDNNKIKKMFRLRLRRLASKLGPASDSHGKERLYQLETLCPSHLATQ